MVKDRNTKMVFNFLKSKKKYMLPAITSEKSFPPFDSKLMSLEDQPPGESSDSAKRETPEKASKKFFKSKSEETKPVFLKIGAFESINNDLAQVHASLKDDTALLTSLAELETEQDQAYTKWRTTLEDIHKKLLFIDETLFKRR